MGEVRDQIIFNNVPKSFPIDADVECQYTIKSTHKASTYDWIGLFKVGWASQKEYISFYWAPFPADREGDEEHQSVLIFQSKDVDLPMDDGEYYQFVYFNKNGKMSGSSSPFYFFSPRNDDIVEEVMSDDTDMLYITTKKGQLVEKKKECEKLAKTCDALNQEILNQAEQLKLSEDRRVELEGEKDALLIKIEEVAPRAEKLAETEQLVEVRDEQIATLKEEVELLQSELDCLKLEQAVLLDQLKVSEDSTTAEVELLKKRLAEALREREAFDTLQAQLSAAQDSVNRLEQYKKQQKEVIAEQHDKLLATEARHTVDLEEIKSLTETLTNLSSKVEEVNSTNEDLKNKLAKVSSQYDDEKMDWVATLEKMEKEKNSLLSTIVELNRKLDQIQSQTVSAESFDIQEDRYIALQAAYSLLKDELREQNKNLATLQRREQRHRVSSSVQIEELKEKLKESADEYNKLGTQKAKLDRRLSKASRSTGICDSALLKKTMSSSSQDELTREELLKMIEQLNTELEARTLKKERYKDKYLEEKQRASTVRDHYKSEVEKLKGDLALARAQLDTKVISTPPISVAKIVYPAVGAGDATLGAGAAGANSAPVGTFAAALRASSAEPRVKASPTPFEYPDVRPKVQKPPKVAARSLSTDGSIDKPKGALEQSIVEEKAGRQVLTPLPAPIEPLRTQLRDETPQATSSPQHASVPYPSAMLYPREPKKPEEIVLPAHQSDSDEDNEGTDRYQDALDEPSTVIKCFYCDKVFDLHDSEEVRNAHACAHLDATTTTIIKADSVEDYQCPICPMKFSKKSFPLDAMQAHVDAHFTRSQ